MPTKKQCKTAELIALYGNKSLKKYVSTHKVKYSASSYHIALNLECCDYEFQYIENELPCWETYKMLWRTRIRYWKTCRKLLSRIKFDTKRKEVE